MSRTKVIKLPPLDEYDLNVVEDGQFIDSYGSVVKHGDRIIIEHNYNYQHHNNREALVEWNPQKGMYNYVFVDDTRFKSRNDFYGIHSFKLIVKTKEDDNIEDKKSNTGGINQYFKDLEKWENSFYCNECGTDNHTTDFHYSRCVANGDVYKCNNCKNEIIVAHKPNEDDY